MRLTPIDTDRFRLVVLGFMTAVAVLSMVLAIYLGQNTAAIMRSELSERSQTIAAALHTRGIQSLRASKGDDTAPIYADFKRQLAAVQQANPDARSIYIMGREQGRLFFYVDSEQPGSPDYSAAGEWYDDGTPADHAMFDTGEEVVEGPVSDEYGTFISGLAPVKDPATGQVLAVVGIDVAAATYWRDITLAALVPLMTGLSVIVIIVFFENIRRRNGQLLSLRSELVSVASHELRNPITGIRWAADSLEKLNTDEKLNPMIHAIKNTADELQASTDDILELSHAMNRRSLTIAPTDMAALMQEVFDVQLLSADQKGVRLAYDASWPAQLTIPCDAGQMKRVLHNIISNAIKYTRDHTTVTVGYQHDPSMHYLSVSDQGIGIPADEQAKVFKGFYRASNAVASKAPGTGLGLYLVKTVIEQHGGRVRYTSVQNKGTVFILGLPKH